MILNKEELKEGIIKKGLISGFVNLDKQLTPNGFDLSVKEIFEFLGKGSVDFSNVERVIPETKKLEFAGGWLELKQGCYKIKTNESVKFSNDMIGIMRPRSTLLRMGATVDSGVIDAGFEGRLEFLLIVTNKHGIRIKEDARVLQLVIFRMKETGKGYNGIYAGLK